MRAVSFDVYDRYGDRRSLVGFPAGVPGLVVNAGGLIHRGEHRLDGTYRVTHWRSGCVVGWDFGSPEAALAAARELAGLADWTVDFAGLRGEQRRVREPVREIVERYGGRVNVHPAARVAVDNASPGRPSVER